MIYQAKLLLGESNTALYAGLDMAVAINTPTSSLASKSFWKEIL